MVKLTVDFLEVEILLLSYLVFYLDFSLKCEYLLLEHFLHRLHCHMNILNLLFQSFHKSHPAMFRFVSYRRTYCFHCCLHTHLNLLLLIQIQLLHKDKITIILFTSDKPKNVANIIACLIYIQHYFFDILKSENEFH